jgi:hypothetical protein
LYFSSEENKFRPSLAINFGRVYPYATIYDDSLVEGVTTAITPCIVFDHKFGDKQKIGITYGIGPVFYTNPEINKTISKITGNDFTLSFSCIFGVNFFIF